MSEQPNEMMAILQKMQQQLTYLEKKLDTLLQQSQQKPPFNRDRNFSRPFRPFGNRPSGPNDRPGQGPRPGGHQPHGQGGSGGHFAKKKPFFGRPRRDQ